MFGGTPPAKPLICTIRFVFFDAARDGSGADHFGAQPELVLAKFNLTPADITWMPICFRSQIFHLSLIVVAVLAVCSA